LLLVVDHLGCALFFRSEQGPKQWHAEATNTTARPVAVSTAPVGGFAVVRTAAIDPVIVLYQAIMAGAKKKPHFLAQARVLANVLRAEEQPTRITKRVRATAIHSRVFSKDNDGDWLGAANQKKIHSV
jgi:hypothetical protein